MNEIEFAYYKDGFEDQAVKLFQDVFNQPVTPSQWRWKYFGQGLENVKSIFAFDIEGRLVGHFGGLPVRMLFKGKEITAHQGVDVMVHHDYRKGIRKDSVYFRMSKVFYEGIPSFVYGLINKDHLKLGKITGFYEDCIAVKDYVLSPKKIFMPFYKFEEIRWDEPMIDKLWEKASEDIGWGIVRDRRFLSWRYKDNLFREYKIYGLKKRFSNELLAWLVVREYEDELFFMDMIFIDRCLEPLLKSAASYFVSKASGIKLWLAGRYDDRLLNLGFEKFDRGTFIPNCIWVRRYSSSEMADSFYYTMGDTDFL